MVTYSRQRIIKKIYEEDNTFRSGVKQLISLAFLPVNNSIKRFDLIVNEFDDDFLNNFEKTWISKPKGEGTFLRLLKTTNSIIPL